jgi:hypothetical protein
MAKQPSPRDRTELPSPLDSAGLSAPLDRDPVREALLRRVEPVAAAWAAQDAELDAEIAALAAAGALTVPAEEERPGPALDPGSAPADGLHAWLTDLPGSLLDEYLAVTAGSAPGGLRAGPGGCATHAGAGFAADGVADLLSPGPVLAGLAEDAHAAGLGRLTDDELAGVIRAGRQLSSWASALELEAVGDLMRRREGQEAAGQPHAAEHVDAEIAALLTLTGRGAGRVLDLAIALRRLPLTARALAAGVIDVPRVAAIADETTGLGDDHAADVERHILVRAPGQTTSQVRAAARRAVLAADPRAARKRQEQAQREARVERWDEHAGTAALAGRDLPPAEVIAADQHISALARGLRAAGLTGTADQLRAQVFLALLSGAPAASLLPAGQHYRDPAVSDSGTSAGPGMPGNPAVPGSPTTGSGPGTAPPSTSATAGWPGIPAVAGMVNLTMPLSTWLGLLNSPGEVAGFGPLAAHDSRQLGMAMAGHPETRWCVTLIGVDGRPVAHGCARPGCGLPGPPPGTRSPPRQGRAPLEQKPKPPGPTPAPPAQGRKPRAQGSAPLAHGPVPTSEEDAHVAAWLASIPMKRFESAECAHLRQSAAYRPPPSLRHLIGVRQQVCAFPGCRRPASQCDFDHTTPFQRGGPTCECNLAPLCRKHHEAKQAPGWRLEQSRPGILTWTTPSGRTYTTGPTVYPG